MHTGLFEGRGFAEEKAFGFHQMEVMTDCLKLYFFAYNLRTIIFASALNCSVL